VRDILATFGYYIQVGWAMSEIYLINFRHTQIVFLAKNSFPLIELIVSVDENSSVIKTLDKMRFTLYHTYIVIAGRQHYLRFEISNIFSTFEVLEKGGLLRDSTLGFADREGFPCGTSYPYHPYDLKNDAEYKITERPLAVNGWNAILLSRI
jgi:hypothetical protein